MSAPKRLLCANICYQLSSYSQGGTFGSSLFRLWYSAVTTPLEILCRGSTGEERELLHFDTEEWLCGSVNQWHTERFVYELPAETKDPPINDSPRSRHKSFGLDTRDRHCRYSVAGGNALLICRTACWRRFSFSTSAIRTYPSPSSPNPRPGASATFAFSRH